MQHKIRNLLSISVWGKLKEKSNYLGLLFLIQASSHGLEAAIPGMVESTSNERYISCLVKSKDPQIEGLVDLKMSAALKDSSDSKLKNKPKWVDMMYDSNVNYFEAKKEFQEFWKDRGEPEEKDEKEKEKRSLAKRIMKSDKAIEEENTELLLPYKRFRKWLVDMEPYVQPDGSILSIEEQKQIWENSRK